MADNPSDAGHVYTDAEIEGLLARWVLPSDAPLLGVIRQLRDERDAARAALEQLSLQLRAESESADIWANIARKRKSDADPSGRESEENNR